jgi:hypothetical protein
MSFNVYCQNSKFRFFRWAGYATATAEFKKARRNLVVRDLWIRPLGEMRM